MITSVELAQALAGRLGRETIDPETPFADMGLDSIDVVEMFLVCEELGVYVPLHLRDHCESVAALHEWCEVVEQQ